MPSAARPIVLTTRSIGAYSGVSRVAPDVMLALSRCSSDLTLRAWVPGHLPAQLDGHALRPYRVQDLPLGLIARAVARGLAPPRSLFEHTRLALRARLQPSAAQVHPASLEIVNGLGAHALYQAALDAGRSGAAGSVAGLIVHESVRHFEERGTAALQDAISAMRSYAYRVFVSDHGRAEWNALAGLDPARSLYIPNCVHEQRVDQVRARDRAQLRRSLDYRDDALQLVVLGSVTHRKGQDLLIDALRTLADLQPRLNVDLLGPSASPWAKRLAASIKVTPLASRVRWLGTVEDAYERVYAADALVLPSRAEAFPMSVLEALALGTCVVAAGVDGVPEQVEHEQSGLLFARQDSAALAGQLRRVATSPQLRAAWASAGRQRYLNHFTRDRQLERWVAAVREMV